MTPGTTPERECCRVCGRSVRLTKDERFARHRPPKIRGSEPIDPDQPCPGSGEPCWAPMFSEKGESQAKQLMEREYARMQDQVERLKAEVDTASLKIDELRSDRAWSEQARGECLLEIDRLKRHLGNLLARIHRDGGHHTEAVGLEQSVADAYEIVARLHVTRGNEP